MTVETLTVLPMNGEVTGADVERRRDALGLDIAELAERAGVDRATLRAFEKGTKRPRPASVRAIVGALEQLEHEVSGPYDEQGGMVTYRLSGNFGVDVTLEGPVMNLTELEASIARLLAQMQQPPSEPPSN